MLGRKVEVLQSRYVLASIALNLVPDVIPSPTEVQYRSQVIFHGLSVDPYGEQQKANATVCL